MQPAWLLKPHSSLQVYDSNMWPRPDTLIGQASFQLQSFREQLLRFQRPEVGCLFGTALRLAVFMLR